MAPLVLTIDHTAGGHGRETAAIDETGRAVLRVKGDWAILDADGRWILYWVPDAMAAARAGAIDGLLSGLLGLSDSGPNPGTLGRNAGPGRQAIRRPDRPIRGMLPRGAPVIATVVRELTEPGTGPGPYRVEVPPGADAIEIGFRFVPVADAAASTASTGFADPRYATYLLQRVDGRPIVRHQARIARDLTLVASTIDVLDPEFPLDEAVALSLARFHAWRS